MTAATRLRYLRVALIFGRFDFHLWHLSAHDGPLAFRLAVESRALVEGRAGNRSR